MLNFIWPFFLIISYAYAIVTGKITEINDSIFNSTENAINFVINLLGTICLWNGIMQIAMKTSLVQKLMKVFKPIMKWLFPDVEQNSETYKQISMNVVANIMGLGNAATPMGLKAMKSMNEKNEDKSVLSNSMAIFIVLNTASIQLIPTTVIAIRSAMRFY